MKRLLVVDDAIFMRRLIKDVARDAGWEVVGEAANGEEAVALYREHRPDLVTMDVVMPVMNGLEAAAKICERFPPPLRPHMVALTANAMKEDRDACLAVGMDGYVSKPVRLEKLSEVLREVQTRILQEKANRRDRAS